MDRGRQPTAERPVLRHGRDPLGYRGLSFPAQRHLRGHGLRRRRAVRCRRVACGCLELGRGDHRRLGRDPCRLRDVAYLDGDGFFREGECGTPADCNDVTPGIYPGAPEICDGIDNDCSFTPDDHPDCDGLCDAPDLGSRKILRAAITADPPPVGAWTGAELGLAWQEGATGQRVVFRSGAFPPGEAPRGSNSAGSARWGNRWAPP
jgi:hypothetical protein